MLTKVEQLAARIAALQWKEPESVMLLVLGEGELRPAVWGFEGARYFRSVSDPKRFVQLLAAVPS